MQLPSGMRGDRLQRPHWELFQSKEKALIDSLLENPTRDKQYWFLYHARSSPSPSPGLFHMSDVSEKSKLRPRGRGKGEGEDGQEQSPPYLVPTPSPSRRDKKAISLETRGAGFSGQDKQTSVPEAGTKIRRYEGTWIFAPAGDWPCQAVGDGGA